MKTMLKILVGVVVLVVLILVGLHMVLKWRLGLILNQRVAPAVERQAGVKLAVGDASFDVLRGKLTVDALTLANPEGFSAGNIAEVQALEVEMSVFDFLTTGMLEISRLDVRGGRLALDRTSDQGLNLDVVNERLAGQTASPPVAPSSAPTVAPAPTAVPAGPAPEVAPSAATMPDVLVRDGSVDLTVSYADSALDAANPLRLVLHEVIQFSGLRLGSGSTNWAPFTVRGGMEGDESVCATRLEGRIAPIVDPDQLSFDVTGEVAGVEPSFVARYLDKEGVTCGGVSVDVRLSCRDGVFEEGVSQITLVTRDLRLSADLAKKVPAGLDRFERLSIPLGVRGTLQEPRTDGVETVLMKTALANVMDNPRLQKALMGAVVDALSKKSKKKPAAEASGATTTNAPARDSVDDAVQVGVDLLKQFMK